MQPDAFEESATPVVWFKPGAQDLSSGHGASQVLVALAGGIWR